MGDAAYLALAHELVERGAGVSSGDVTSLVTMGVEQVDVVGLQAFGQPTPGRGVHVGRPRNRAVGLLADLGGDDDLLCGSPVLLVIQRPTIPRQLAAAVARHPIARAAVGGVDEVAARRPAYASRTAKDSGSSAVQPKTSYPGRADARRGRSRGVAHQATYRARKPSKFPGLQRVHAGGGKGHLPFVLLACVAPVASAAAADRVLVANVPRAVAQANAPACAPSTERMRLGLVLAHPHPAAEDALLRGLFDRSSPTYHHFFTPGQYAQRFGVAAATQRTCARG